MQKEKKRRVVKAPSAPARDKMVKVATRKAMCPSCEALYRRGFDVCPQCGRKRIAEPPLQSRYGSENGNNMEVK